MTTILEFIFVEHTNELIYLLLVAFMSLVYTKRFKNKTLKMMKNNQSTLIANNTKLNFDKDIEFLLYLISYKCEHTKKFMLDAKNVTSTSILNDGDLSNNVDLVVINVTKMINNNYRIILYRYFTPEGLVEFITENVLYTLTSDIVKLNHHKISKLHTTVKTEKK